MGRRTTFTYGASSTTVTDPNGNVDVQNYTNGLLTSITRGSGTPQAATWTYGYQSPTLAATSVTDPDGHTSRATYDAQANLLTQTDGLGRTTAYTYDALNDLTSIKDPLGHTTTLTYDASGNLLSKSQSVTETGQTARTTYAYGDSAHPGDVTSTTDPNGAVWTYTYDPYGNRTKRVDPVGNTTTSTFDALGRPTTTVSPKGNVPGADPASFTTSHTYDAFGDLLTTTDPLGDRTVNRYDEDRDLVSTTDADGHATTYAYNADNELTSITRPDGTVTAYGYDGDGNRTTWTDGNGNVTNYGYDSLGREISIADPLARTTTRAYDGAGNLVSVTDPANQTTTYAYDAGNELLKITYSDGKTPNVTFSYNADGQVASESSSAVSRAYTYDSLSRLAKTTDQATILSAVLGGGGASSNVLSTDVTYGYDLAGRVTSLGIDLGIVGVAPVITHTFTRTYDAAGEMTAVSDGLGHTTTFAYDPDHNNVSETYPNGTLASYRYDSADRLAQTQDSGPAGVFLSEAYTRDATGRVTRDDASGASGPNLSYTYDTVNRLSSSTPVTSGPAHSYGYDAADNRTSWATSGGTNTYVYDKANELTSASLLAGAQASFAYDSRGNRVTESDNAGNQITYGYDQANRLVSYTGPTLNEIGHATGVPIQQARYAYDASGLRTDLAWDLAEGIPLIVGDAAQNTYVTGPDGLPVERIDLKGDVAYYHHDQLGSTRALTGSDGSVLVTYSYDPYGNTTSSAPDYKNPFRFAGQYTDAATGLIYMRARWYDPATAEFVASDPDALSGEPYVYADGDPVNNSDPLGLCASMVNPPGGSLNPDTGSDPRCPILYRTYGQTGNTLGLRLQGKFKNEIVVVYGGFGFQQNKKTYPYRIGPYTPRKWFGLFGTSNLDHTFTWYAPTEFRSGSRYEIAVVVNLGSYQCYYFETGVNMRH
jgi:RHS repeat-associated protein